MQHDPHHHDPDSIELPTPTAWPIIAAFGLSLLFLGLVTNLFVSAVGLIAGLIGAAGWFGDVFPHPKHESVPLRPEAERPQPVRTQGREVQMLAAGQPAPNRAHVPTEVHPYRVGVQGGILGGIVMAILAVGFGVIKYGSIWYPINLLAAAGLPSFANESLDSLKNFHLDGLIVGVIAHGSISVLVGLLYAVLVPMFPRRWEWFLGGFVTPLLWTGLVFATLSMVNPKLESGIDWFWFVVCQFAFGLVCGFVVYRSGKVSTLQDLPLAARLGVESQHREEKNS